MALSKVYFMPITLHLFFFFQHPFIKDFTNNKCILNLLSEAKAEVEEIVQDIDEEEEIKQMKVKIIFDYIINCLYFLLCRFNPNIILLLYI